MRKNPQLSDVYQTEGGLFTAFAHLDGERVKVTLMASELAQRKGMNPHMTPQEFGAKFSHALAMEHAVTAIIKDVCELPDYTSPEDNPNLLQCTVEELTLILRRHLLGEDEAPREEWPSVMDHAATPFADNH